MDLVWTRRLDGRLLHEYDLLGSRLVYEYVSCVKSQDSPCLGAV